METQRLLLLDLDNTLIDRAALFRGWATDFLYRHGLDERDVAWLEEQDGDGLVPKDTFFTQVRVRYGLDATTHALQSDYYDRYPAFTVPPCGATLESLASLRKPSHFCSNANATADAAPRRLLLKPRATARRPFCPRGLPAQRARRVDRGGSPWIPPEAGSTPP